MVKIQLNRLKNASEKHGGLIRLIHLAGTNKSLFSITILLMILKMITTILFIILISQLFEHILILLHNDREIQIEDYWFEVMLLFAFPFINSIMTLLIRKSTFLASFKIRSDIRNQLIKKLLRLEIGYLQDNSTSGIVNDVVDGIEALEVFYEEFLPHMIYSMVIPISLFFFFLTKNVVVAFILLISFPLIPGSIMLVQKKAQPLMQSYWSSYSDVGAIFLDNLQGLNTLKNFTIDEKIQLKMTDEFWKFRNITMDVLRMQLKSIKFMDSIAYGVTGLVIVVGIFPYYTSSFLNPGVVSGLIIIVLLSIEFFLPLRRLGSAFHAGMNGIAASHGIFNILDSVPKLSPYRKLEKGEKFEIKGGDIDFSQVYFRYSEIENNERGSSYILHDISFSIKEGTSVALIGNSGSGKSTIANLIARFYDIDKGSIHIGKVEIKNIPIDYLRQKIAYIGVNTYIFSGSIRDNLLLVNSQLSENKLIDACYRAGLKDFLEKKGLDFDVGEWGKKLSGGEKQRIAIARALLLNPEIYIFDEATSNIDVESEEIIWNSIYSIIKGKTALIISHRLQTVQDVDKIIILEKGQIVEQGTHEELLKINGYYSRGIQEQSILEN